MNPIINKFLLFRFVIKILKSPRDEEDVRVQVQSEQSCDNSSSDSEPEPAAKKKIYTQKFREQWKETFKWLDLRDSKAYCVVCHMALKGGTTHFKRHEKNALHGKNYEKAKNTPKINKYVKEPDNNLEKSVKRAELKLVAFLHEHNLPFLLINHLVLLLVSIFPKSDVAKGLKCNRTKATQMTKDCFAQEQLITIANTFKDQHFSLIIDETTDVSTQKSLVLIARYFDNHQQRSRDMFIGLLRVKDCTAKGIFEAINNYLREINVY